MAVSRAPRTLPTLRRLGWAAGLGLPVLVMLAVAVVWLFGIGTPHFMLFPRPFDPGLWKTADRYDDARCRMVGDLTYRIGLVGRTADEVHRLLGPPDEKRYERWGKGNITSYFLCLSAADHFVMELAWQGDRVAAVEVRDT